MFVGIHRCADVGINVDWRVIEGAVVNRTHIISTYVILFGELRVHDV